MNIKHKEIIIETENPFANCKLDRKKYSEVLTGIIEAYSEGFVLAINNKWGTGKTTFIRMWEQDLKNNGFQTVYFNAWENDFENNPLVALMGELKTLTNKPTDPAFQRILKKASILSKHIIPIVAQSVVDKYIDTKGVKDAIVEASKGVADLFENDVNQYSNKKKSIQEFRTELSHYIANTNNGKPLIFIIDELDRCRPNYSVSILEQIKHFFSIPDIVFILSIDKEQLGNAVRGVYGSDRIDSNEYLKRFIDIEYSIPEPDKDIFYKYLYSYFDFDDFLENSVRKKHSELASDKRSFLEFSAILFSSDSVTLRHQEKIFAHCRLALRAFGENMYLIPEVFLFLIHTKVLNEEYYNNIKFKKLSISDLQGKFYQIIKNKLNEDTERLLMWLEAYLILFYSNYINKFGRMNNIYKYDSDQRKNILLVDSIINNSNKDRFLDIFENIERSRNGGSLDLSHFIKRIDLTESIIN
ncbi:KAP family P-loop NTPase fold protein [Flavobacterium ginsenosidimutans]|uniref:P-loop NTPase fold protein n=1 Tax=Flavobacterium ginsenosidimutans TaxID=687844 RepID=A0ABZ2Q1G6_9FLAO